jgi:hypothetical protein
MLSNDEKRARVEKAQSYREGSRNHQVTAPLLEIIWEQAAELADLRQQLEQERERNRNLQDAKSRVAAERDTYQEQAQHNAEKLQQTDTALLQIAQEHAAEAGTPAERLAWIRSELRQYDDCKNAAHWARERISQLEHELAAAHAARDDQADASSSQGDDQADASSSQGDDQAQEQERYGISTAGNPHAQDKGGKLPYGYSRTSRGTEVRPGEAAIVKRIFQRWDKGQSARQIARDLNSDNIPTPRAGSKGWTHQAVNIILGNAHIYLGNDEYYPAILNTASPRQQLPEFDTDILK